MEAGDTESSALEDSDVIEIVPSEDYDIGKAKLRLSLLWLLHRSYDDQIPREFQDPFYENSDGVSLLKPQLVRKLASGEVYFIAYGHLFPEAGPLYNFSTLIQTLSRRGIYVTDYDGHAVTESILVQTAPFKVKSHLSLMDALMKCYTHRLVSIEKIVQTVRSIVNFDASKELPNSVEEALLFWVNKVCLYVQDLLRKEYRSQHEEPKSDPLGRTVPSIPMLGSLRDIGEGCALAVLISFYCPDQLRLQDIVLKSSISIADSLFNLRLIQNFCSRHMFSPKCFHFTYEDLLYSDDLIFPNIYVYLADLFNKFENNKSTKGALPEVKNETEGIFGDRMSASQSVSKVPISNATKKSFQNVEHPSISQESYSPVSTPPPRQPLLQKRYQQGVSDKDGAEYPGSGEPQKVKVRPAWQDSSDLLRHTGDGDTSITNYHNRSSDLDHWAASQSSTPEPLMPARLKPAKEKSSNHSKSVERGDQMEGSKPRRTSINVKPSHDEGFVSNPLGDHDVSREESSLQQLFKRNSLTSEQSSTFPRSRHSSGASNPEDSQQRPFVIGQSFTLPDRASTLNSARLEGLPVVQGGNPDEIELRRCVSREGSIASNRSSGDFSDHESQKIHRDHKAKETKESKDTFILSDQVDSRDLNHLTKPLVISHPIEEEIIDKTKTTNFAQIKKMRDMSGPLTTLVYMQRGQDLESPNKLSPKDSFHKKDDEKSDKKTGFAPHQTTWQQQRRPGSALISVSQESSPEGQSQSVSDTMNIRMKLEERRKQIEQKKHELERHQTKIRQQVGKEALLHVVASQNTLDKNGQIPPGIPPNIRRYIRQANGGMVGGGRVGESVPEEDSSSIIDSHRSSQKPFSREEIQRTIENARKKWLNEADAVKKNESYEADSNEQSSEAPLPEPTRQAPLRHEPVKPEPVSIRPEPVHQDLGPVRPEPRYHESIRQPVPVRQEPHREPVPMRQEPHREPVPMRQEPIQQEAAVIRPQPVVAVQPGIREDHSRSHVSPEGRDHHRDRSSSGEREENYENYNHSLDRLNRSLTDLQGEIMKLSLQQQQIKSQGLEKTHPKQLGMVPSVSAAGVVHNQHGQQFVLHSPTPPAQPYISPVISPYPTQPPHSVGPHQHLPNTYTTSIGQPIPTATPFSGLPGHPKPDIAGIHPSMANAVITSTAGGVLSLHGTHARTQEEPVPSGYSPHPHAVSSSGYVPYSSSNNNNVTGETDWQSPVGSPRNKGIRPTHTESPSSSPPRQPPLHGSPPRQPPLHGSPPRQPPLHGSPPRQPPLHGSPPRQPPLHSSPPRQPPPHGSPPRQPPHTSPQHQPSKLVSTVKSSVIEEAVPESDDSTEIADEQTTVAGNEGFFVSFGNDAPRRPKPKLMPKREKKEEKKEEKKPAPKEEPVVTSEKQLAPVTFDPSLYMTNDDVPAAPPVGFVVKEPEEEVSEDQIIVRKNRMLKLQQKRREEQERRRQEKEEALAKKREQEMLKKEEIERRKANEKARREFILQQYKERKRKEEDEEKNGPSERYERPSRPHKPRPKSMIVRSTKPPEACDDEVGSIHSTSSQEDLAGRGFSSPTSSSSNLSMNLLANQGNSSRSGFGRRPPSPVMMNLFTHQNFTGRTGFGRRPPSPDLYRFGRKSGKSTESSSDAGSTAGSDYTGPKLFVKPSSKSNRHIIINAISHCCLAGSVNTDLKNKVLEEIAKSDAKHFVILFRDAGCAFRSLYAYYPEREEAVKIHGIGPKLVTSKNIEKYYKYNSGGKSFSEVTSTKHLSVSIDAVVINGNLWKNSKSISRR